MLGVGIGMLDLAFTIIWEQWLTKPLSKRVTPIFSRVAIGSVFLLFALPHAIHYVADQNLRAKDYTVCEAACHQWLFVRNIVYVQETIEYSESLKNK